VIADNKQGLDQTATIRSLPLTTKELTRREFLRATSENARYSLLIMSAPSLLLAGQQAHGAMLAGEEFATLNGIEATEFAAIAARIIPTDDTPGATEAGVIYFMDNVLSSSRAELLPDLRAGLLELQQSANSKYGNPLFSALSADQQDSLLRDIEQTAFFDAVHYLTIAGMFASPALGGNRDRVGWSLMGFENQHAWVAPYGYYDAQQMELEK
jgi:gluconate 2-dehydrogenase gamma chain